MGHEEINYMAHRTGNINMISIGMVNQSRILLIWITIKIEMAGLSHQSTSDTYSIYPLLDQEGVGTDPVWTGSDPCAGLLGAVASTKSLEFLKNLLYFLKNSGLFMYPPKQKNSKISFKFSKLNINFTYHPTGKFSASAAEQYSPHLGLVIGMALSFSLSLSLSLV